MYIYNISSMENELGITSGCNSHDQMINVAILIIVCIVSITLLAYVLHRNNNYYIPYTIIVFLFIVAAVGFHENRQVIVGVSISALIVSIVTMIVASIKK